MKRLAICGMMTAIAVILEAYFKIPFNLFGTFALKLSLGLGPILYLSIRFGPIYGGFCGAVMDFLQVALAPIGAFNPLFTISAFVMGCIPGIFFLKPARADRLRIACSIAVGQIVGAVILNTVFLVISYGLPWQIIIPRALTQAISIPAYAIIVILLLAAETKRGVPVSGSLKKSKETPRNCAP